jgi:hypothetical protein
MCRPPHQMPSVSKEFVHFDGGILACCCGKEWKQHPGPSTWVASKIEEICALTHAEITFEKSDRISKAVARKEDRFTARLSRDKEKLRTEKSPVYRYTSYKRHSPYSDTPNLLEALPKCKYKVVRTNRQLNLSQSGSSSTGS